MWMEYKFVPTWGWTQYPMLTWTSREWLASNLINVYVKIVHKSEQYDILLTMRGSGKFWQRGSNVFFIYFFIRGKRIQIALKAGPIGPPAKRHFNGVSLAGHWLPYIECCLGSFVIFQGIRTSIAHCRQTDGTVRKSFRTCSLVRNPKDNKGILISRQTRLFTSI